MSAIGDAALAKLTPSQLIDVSQQPLLAMVWSGTQWVPEEPRFTTYLTTQANRSILAQIAALETPRYVRETIVNSGLAGLKALNDQIIALRAQLL